MLRGLFVCLGMGIFVCEVGIRTLVARMGGDGWMLAVTCGYALTGTCCLRAGL